MSSGSPIDSSPHRVSIVVTNYNGRGNLGSCLPGLLGSWEANDKITEVILVDDCSDDDSVDWVRENFPQVRIVVLLERTGFQGAANAGFDAAQGDLVALFSNDMVPDRDFLTPLIGHFQDPTTFAVACQLFDPDGSPQSGRTIGSFLTGNLMVVDSAKGYRPLSFLGPWPSDRACQTLYTGGNALYDRKKFKELGGFDSLYHPFYWEDLDLCFRAWSRGFRVLYEPLARVFHNRSQGTIRRFYSKSFAQTARRRNRLLFTWRNLDDPLYWMLHLIALAIQTAFSWIILDTIFYKSFYEALRRVSAVRNRRKNDPPRVRSNRRILADAATCPDA